MTRTVDITGKVFGRLTVLRMLPDEPFVDKNSGKRSAACECECSCGTVKRIRASSLRRDRTQSCGCLQKEVIAQIGRSTGVKHGLSKSKEHLAWSNMLDRCFNPNNKYFHNYGGREIFCCSAWSDSFVNFYNAMGPCPLGHSLDRIDNEQGYNHQNCRWADAKTQAKNRRTARMLTFREKTQSLVTWCEELHLDYNIMKSRLKCHWPVEQAFTTPTRRTKQSNPS